MFKYIAACLLLSAASFPLQAQNKTSMELIHSPMPADSYQLAADFNEDGKPDLATSNGVLLGNGDGTFQAPLYFVNAGAGISDISAVDIDGDGHLDIIGVNYTTNTTYVVVYYGNGDGTFQAGTPTTIPNSTIAATIAVADFTGDKLQDIAVGTSDGSAGSVQIYKNLGNRTFSPTFTAYLPDQVSYLRAGDFDGDNLVDLAVAGLNNVFVLWGNKADGSSTTLLKTYQNEIGLTLSVGDLNLDGRPDILVGVNCSTAPAIGKGGSLCLTMDVFYGGQGPQKTLYRNIASNLLFQVGTLTAVDINGDGIGDIAASGRDNTGVLSGIFFFLGHPDGTFDQVPQRFIANSDSVGDIVMGDFNRDGMMDFLSPLYGSDTSQIYLNATTKTACPTSKLSPTVIVCSPPTGAYSPSPIHLQATTFDTTPLVSLQEYLDNKLTYSTTKDTFSISQPATPGSHHFVTKAVDKKGSIFYTDRRFTVYTGTPGTTCSTPASTATICLPGTSTAHSPLRILANANTSNVPTAAQLYIDGKLAVNENNSGTTLIDTTQPLAKGTHLLVFKLYDDTGHVASTSKNITID